MSNDKIWIFPNINKIDLDNGIDWAFDRLYWDDKIKLTRHRYLLELKHLFKTFWYIDVDEALGDFVSPEAYKKLVDKMFNFSPTLDNEWRPVNV